jgi:predicted nucleic acid-binding protein
MVNALVDTAILIDVLRGNGDALAWASTQTDIGITTVTLFELVEGARDKQELQRILAFLQGFPDIDLHQADLSWAAGQLIKYRLSHHVDAFDCLIAAPSHRLQIPLYTPNLKHFTPLIGSLAQKPY